jgi:DHA1 family bicyclomycin/chloramphenicol resistance-like MFS transporter
MITRLKLDSVGIPWLLSLAIAIVLMSTDIYAPCLPAMVQAFTACEADLQLTVSLNSIGYCVMSLLAGPISDAHGRRRIILLSLLGFMIATLGCATAPNLTILILWRLLQGFAGAAVPIVGVAVLADVLKGARFASMMAYMGIVITLSFAVAPIIGGYIGAHLGWRATFYFIASVASCIGLLIYVCVPETLAHKTKFSPQKMFVTYKTMLNDRIFILCGLASGLILGGFVSYIVSSSYLYIGEWGLHQVSFGLLTGIGMTTNALAHLVVGRLIAKFGPLNVIKAGAVFISLGSATMAVMTVLDVRTPTLLLIPVLLYNISIGFTLPPTFTIAFERFWHATGSASSLLASLRMLIMAVCIYASGQLYNKALVSISSIFIACGFLTFGCAAWIIFLTKRAKTEEAPA